MNPKRKSYYNQKWFEYSKSVKKRDNYTCLKCGREEPEVVLQTHHTLYKHGLEPWDYPLSDCLTLCKGCHSREHDLIEPNSGWTLISIDDLGDLVGICERNGCGNEIRYEHLIYHPKWGYKTVGSTCIEYLTRDDQVISKEVIKLLKKISDFINQSTWEEGFTQKGKRFLHSTYSHNVIRIYGSANNYAFQIGIKIKGERKYDFKEIIKAPNKNLNQVKELGFIVLKGLSTENLKEKELLRNIYKRMKSIN
ncbi:HNH endonuclease [Flectobacillus roseus]|uniref:HNH endonuclease n=1 Tax=Flectobacillus roseus TaxID=502259 RepID=UPI0024B717B4|nr:hypothetical protein [Flectobacillus roseus]MDI9872628.1 hypothetical protein [Flectobacillus roseus]